MLQKMFHASDIKEQTNIEYEQGDFTIKYSNTGWTMAENNEISVAIWFGKMLLMSVLKPEI